MSDAIVCDRCGVKLILDGPGGREDANAESTEWIRVGLRDGDMLDACTRICAIELLADDGPLAALLAAPLEGNDADDAT